MIIPLLAAYQITARMPKFNHAVKTPLTSREIMAYTAMMIGCIIIRIILRYFTLRFRGGAGYKCMCSERKALGKELRKVSLGFLNEKNSGDLVSTITSDAAFLEIEGMGVVEKIAVGIPTFIIELMICLSFDYIYFFFRTDFIFRTLIFFFSATCTQCYKKTYKYKCKYFF